MNCLRFVPVHALLLAVVGLVTPAHAQDVLIRGAKVHTMTTSGPLERAYVLVPGGRVVGT